MEKKESKSPEPPAKRDGISKNETDRWLEEFGLDDEQEPFDGYDAMNQ